MAKVYISSVSEKEGSLLKAKVLIGTSGFTYDHWRGVFYPQDRPQAKWLEFYAQNFQTVEINASFYHEMPRKVYEGWAKRIPQDFIFTVKGSRFITHIKRFKDCQEPVERFLEATSGLGEKLAVILWQLPPRWSVDQERLKEFLTALKSGAGSDRFSNASVPAARLRQASGYAPPAAGSRENLLRGTPPRASNRTVKTIPYTLVPRPYRHAFEFRDKSWLNEQIYEILRKHKAALVVQDSPYWPTEEVITADFTYLRFHGRESLYGSCYNRKELENWAQKIKKWAKGGVDVYAFFNNDAQGFAVRNARELRQLVG